MQRTIPALPYSTKALEPYISARTVEIHYEKHHKGYLKKLEKKTRGRPEADRELEELILTAEGDLFNDAAQVWNHDFYWKSMKPEGGGTPEPTTLAALTETFGSLSRFKKELADAANGEFGSGWAWLVRTKEGRLEVRKSSDAENPLRDGHVPLLTIDVWEHAYYLDYQNDRSQYVEDFLDYLINWDFLAKNLRGVQR